MSASHDTLTQIRIDEDGLFPILCKRFGKLIGHAALTFVRRTAGDADDFDIFSGKFNIGTKGLKGFLGTEVLFFLF